MKQLLSLDLTRRGDRAIVGGINDSSPAILSPLTQGDTVTWALQGLRPYTESASPSVYYEARIEWSSLRLGIGFIDAPPTGGSFKLQVGDDITAELPWNAAATTVETALNALASVMALGGLTVLQGKARHFYLIRWDDPAVSTAITITANRLSPRCFPRVLNYDDEAEKFQLLKLIQAPLAYTDAFAYPSPPTVTVERSRAGSSLRNEIQTVSVPAAANGEFDLQFAGFATAAISMDGLTAVAITAALTELYADGAERFRVKELTAAGGRLFQVEFVGPLAKAAQALLGFSMYSQTALPYPEASMTIPAVPVDLILQGSSSTTLGLEIVATDSAGREDTLAQRSVILLNDMLDPGVAEDVAAIATRTETVYVTLDQEQDAIIIGQRGVQVEHPGYEDPEPGEGSATNFEHDLGTFQPLIVVSQLMSVEPEKWRSGHLSWNADSTDANHTTVFLGFQPPEQGTVGAVKVTFINPNAAPWINTHQHPTSDIYRGDGEERQTLDEILAAIVSGMPDGWPSVPGNSIADGSITANKLDLASLAAALRTSTDFLETLRALIPDPEIASKIGAALVSIDTFTATLKTLLARTDVLTVLAPALLGSASFSTEIRSLVSTVMQGDAAAFANALPMTIPAINEAKPPERVTGKLPPLPRIYLTLTDGGTYAETFLPDATAADAGRKLLVGPDGTALARRRKIFPPGATIFSDGFDWYLAAYDGVRYYAREMDRVLFTLEVNEQMLVPGSRFAAIVAFVLQMAAGSNAEGHYRYRLIRGRVRTEAEVNASSSSSGSASSSSSSSYAPPGDIDDIVVLDTIVDTEITVTDVAQPHTFGFSVTRDGEGAMVAKKQVYLAKNLTANAPAQPRFVLRGLLSHFDSPNDVSSPVGQVLITTPGPQVASIVLLEN